MFRVVHNGRVHVIKNIICIEGLQVMAGDLSNLQQGVPTRYAGNYYFRPGNVFTLKPFSGTGVAYTDTNSLHPGWAEYDDADVGGDFAVTFSNTPDKVMRTSNATWEPAIDTTIDGMFLRASDAWVGRDASNNIVMKEVLFAAALLDAPLDVKANDIVSASYEVRGEVVV